MQGQLPKLEVKLATTDQEIQAAQRLRYEVFVTELGGGGAMVDHVNKLETDHYDRFYDHLILVNTEKDTTEDGYVVGVYRLLPGARTQPAHRFYSENEYHLEILKNSGRNLLELGRSCLHADYRGGMAMLLLWQGLSRYIFENKIEILFGVASFHGTDVTALAQPLSLLHQKFLAPPDLRVRAKQPNFESMNLVLPQDLDRPRAMVQLPALIKSYLRIGGFVGEGAYVDHMFNTIDICMVLDLARMSDHQRNLYARGRPG
ncbi:MAG: GNAT family N-acyltransferase [Rhodobacterales bacterium]|nr:GNAT family N-acyltransferase [Rhodobacterales bacterium]